MTTVHVVVPDGIDDPARPSGGNTFDRRVCAGLAGLGWRVHVHRMTGPWPRPDRPARDRLAGVLQQLPDRSVVLLDGIVACGLPTALLPQRHRLHLVVLVHLPLGVGEAGAHSAAARREAAVLRAVDAVVVTSGWTRDWLRASYGLRGGRLVVVHPGAHPAPATAPSPGGGRFACVGAVSRVKGQDVLVDALSLLPDLDWTCTLVGSCCVDATFSQYVARRAATLDDRVTLTGPLVAPALEGVLGRADVLVAPSRVETYGMVVTEALSRGVPVIASAVGGLPEALGTTGDGPPGVLVPAGDDVALSGALRRWLTDPGLRARLRGRAAVRRTGLEDWPGAARSLAGVLSGLRTGAVA